MSLSKTSYSLIISAIRLLVLFYVLLGAYGWFLSDNAIFFPPQPSYSADNVIFIKHGKDQHIAAVHYKNNASRYTVLFSHGNATDLGWSNTRFTELAKHGYSVFAYDYSGYGLSTGRPSEQQSYKDVRIVYDYLVSQLNIKPEHIIVYGHSLGAAVSLDLAHTQRVAGIVLESPFVTAFRVRTIVTLYPFDKFENINKIPRVTAPVFIMHSKDDWIIPFWHSEELFAAAPEPKTSYWLDDVGHNGISTSGTEYWQQLGAFVSSLAVP